MLLHQPPHSRLLKQPLLAKETTDRLLASSVLSIPKTTIKCRTKSLRMVTHGGGLTIITITGHRPPKECRHLVKGTGVLRQKLVVKTNSVRMTTTIRLKQLTIRQPYPRCTRHRTNSRNRSIFRRSQKYPGTSEENPTRQQLERWKWMKTTTTKGRMTRGLLPGPVRETVRRGV